MQYLWSIKQSQRDLRNWAEFNTILKQKHGRELTIMVTEFFMPMKKIPTVTHQELQDWLTYTPYSRQVYDESFTIRLKGVQIENSLMCYQHGSGNSTGMKCLTRIMRSNLLNVDTVFITSLHYLPI